MTTDTATSYKQLVEETNAFIQTIKNDPQRRIQVRKDFYKKYGEAIIPGGLGFGTSEVGFMEWEVKRGVLNPLEGSGKLGSPWWFNVNLEFIFWSELGARVFEAGINPEGLPWMVRFWMDYIKNPSTSTWYRAHNASIVHGYVKFEALAKKESYYEQVFINEVLYRLMYAGAYGDGIDNVPFEKFGHLMFNPKIPTLNIVVQIPAFYPKNYPLSEQDIQDVLYEGRSFTGKLSRVLNEVLILPGLSKFYEVAAEWLHQPQLLDYLKEDEPIYPFKAEQKPASGPVKGQCQSYMALVSLPKSIVQDWLTDDLTMADQSITPKGEHPVFFFFNYNRLHASILPWPVFKYGELAILVPDLKYKNSVQKYAFTPDLWVNNKFVSWLGHVIWKFNKMYATITTTEPIANGPEWFSQVTNYAFNTTASDGLVANMESSNVGLPGMMNSFEGAEVLKSLLSQPGIMGIKGKYMGVTVQMDYDTAEIQPASSTITFGNFPGMSGQTLNVQALADNGFGGYRINWQLTLSWPEKLP